MVKINLYIPVFFFFLFFFGIIHPYAQSRFDNPSFEGDPQDAMVPAGWIPCQDGTTPDILPGPWGVYSEPSDGDTYVGLITRHDGTWESIGQRTKMVLEADVCYTFSVDLAVSATYAGYNNPARLRIWGGFEKCAKDQLLFGSGQVNHRNWSTYSFQFTPEKDMKYIILEAYYSEEKRKPYKGNVLIDNLSPVKPCSRAYNSP